MHVHLLYTMNKTFYDFHCQVLFIQTIYKLDEGLFMHMCIHTDGTVQTEVTLA